MNTTEQNDLRQEKHNKLKIMGDEVRDLCRKNGYKLNGELCISDLDGNWLGRVDFDDEKVTPATSSDLFESPEQHELE